MGWDAGTDVVVGFGGAGASAAVQASLLQVCGVVVRGRDGGLCRGVGRRVGGKGAEGRDGEYD